MFEIDNGKLRVLGPVHKQFKGSQVKALDYVVAVNGKAMDPQDLLNACVSDEDVELKLRRDRLAQLFFRLGVVNSDLCLIYSSKNVIQ